MSVTSTPVPSCAPTPSATRPPHRTNTDSTIDERTPPCRSRHTSTPSKTKLASPPRQLLDIAEAKGLTAEDVKAGQILEWLKTDYDLGRGHGMALVHVIKKGPQIDKKHVGTTGSHRDESEILWLDGKTSKPS